MASSPLSFSYINRSFIVLIKHTLVIKKRNTDCFDKKLLYFDFELVVRYLCQQRGGLRCTEEYLDQLLGFKIPSSSYLGEIGYLNPYTGIYTFKGVVE